MEKILCTPPGFEELRIGARGVLAASAPAETTIGIGGEWAPDGTGYYWGD